jgi:hypothetical protein
MTKKKTSTKKARKGRAPVEVIDLIAEDRKVAEGAELVRSLFYHEGVPDFLTDAVMDALGAARNKAGVDFWQVEPADERGGPYLGPDFDMKGLADLFAVTRGSSFTLDEPKGDSPAAFARHLAEVLRIGRTADFIPAGLYNDLADAWNEFVNTAGDGAAFRELHEGEQGVRLLLEIAGRFGEGGAR